MRQPRLILALSAVLAFVSSVPAACPKAPADPYQPVPYIKIHHPDWCKDATIYELNTRQFTPQGTLKAAEAQLPRIKALNVDIVWLMPIQPIGVKNRKGVLGSPYSIRDYMAVNPELGTLDDLKHFVATAHKLGMHVILDWVGNHTAWDNPLTKEHPDWYQHDWKGDFRPTPWFDWSDIINLDYSKPGLRKYMLGAMKYWVQVAGVDGYRCDAAGFVPLDFWNEARRELDQIKPVFMLGEWESRDLYARAFDATYAWTWYNAMHDIAMGHADLGALYNYLAWVAGFYPPDAIQMTFVSNHDKNSWDGTQFEQFGAALPATITLSVVGEGMPLLYNGQEAGNTKRLKFFERDPIVWKPSPIGDLYRKLFALKHANTALWNGHWGAPMIDVPNTDHSHVLSFVRQNAKEKVFAVFNFSAQDRKVRFEDGLFPGRYTEFFSGETADLRPNQEMDLPAWSYRVYLQHTP